MVKKCNSIRFIYNRNNFSSIKTSEQHIRQNCICNDALIESWRTSLGITERPSVSVTNYLKLRAILPGYT